MLRVTAAGDNEIAFAGAEAFEGDEGEGGGGGSGGGTAARYRILRRVPEDGVVVLTDRAVTRVDIATDGGSLRLVVPPEAK